MLDSRIGKSSKLKLDNFLDVRKMPDFSFCPAWNQSDIDPGHYCNCQKAGKQEKEASVINIEIQKLTTNFIGRS